MHAPTHGFHTTPANFDYTIYYHSICTHSNYHTSTSTSVSYFHLQYQAGDSTEVICLVPGRLFPKKNAGRTVLARFVEQHILRHHCKHVEVGYGSNMV